MKKLADSCAVGVLMLSLCLAGVAYAADPPDECNDDGRDERFFNLGVFKGVSLVEQAWASLEPDPCHEDSFGEFVDIVGAAFEAGAPAPDSPQTVLCHYIGSYAGAVERASELVNEFQCECSLEGLMIGEMAAIFYCELSIALGGLGHGEWLVGVDLTPCGEIFEEACQDRFDEVAYNYPSVVDAQCRPYTEPPYSDPPDGVYEETRHNQCLYEVDP